MKKYIAYIVIFFTYSGCTYHHANVNDDIIAKETVLTPGMTLYATSGNEKICVSAKNNYKRTIYWDGASRTVTLVPRKKRWHGKLGLVSPDPPNNHIEAHKGITRILMEEAQINISNAKTFYKFVNSQSEKINSVYRNDGLWVKWRKAIKPDKGRGGTIDIMIFQILIDGKKPEKLIGSKDDKITVIFPDE